MKNALRPSTKDGGPKDMTLGQRSALWLMAQADFGVQSTGDYQVQGKWHKTDARTIVALVARGYLYGCGGKIYATDAGRVCARSL